MTNADKIATYIGFAVRSNRAIFGLDALRAARKRPYIVLADLSMSPANRKRAEAHAQSIGAAYAEVPEQYLANVLKRDNVKLIAVCDEHLASAIQSQIE